MRLIDADKLKRTEGMFQYQISDAFDRLSASAYRFEDVENAPTVEAIPVEWIEKWIETDHNTKRRTPYYYKRLFRSRLKMMLEDWKKENEND